jgi:hypothetical protein
MQRQVLSIDLIFEDLFVSEDFSRKLAGERFFRMNLTLPVDELADVRRTEVILAEEAYCEFLRYSLS